MTQLRYTQGQSLQQLLDEKLAKETKNKPSFRDRVKFAFRKFATLDEDKDEGGGDKEWSLQMVDKTKTKSLQIVLKQRK